MPKKPIKKISKKEESDDDYEIDEDIIENDIDNDDDDEEDNEYENDDNDENDDLIEQDHDLETETNGCLIYDVINNDDEYFENNKDINNETNYIHYVKKEDRISCDRLAIYEMVRILGERTKQLTMGAKPLVKNYNNLSYEKIAEEELKVNMIPFQIIRPLPNGNFELWALEELNKDHLFSRIYNS